MRLPDNTIQRFQPVIEGLVREVAPAAVVCFGHSVSIANHTNCFQASSSEHNHFDLLIVQSSSGHYKDHEVIDLVKSRFSDRLSVNVISHSERSVLNALGEQHPFFCKVFNEGHVLHLSDNSALEIDLIKTFNAINDQSKHSQEWMHSFDLASGFLELASHALANKNQDIAVFLLHQSMEQLCIASIKAHLNYRPTTHNIVRLISLVCCYIPHAKELFPCNTKDERELFDFLKRAYSDVRYKASYQIPSHLASSLLRRVTEFKNLIEQRYEQDFGKGREKGQINPSSENE